LRVGSATLVAAEIRGLGVKDFLEELDDLSQPAPVEAPPVDMEIGSLEDEIDSVQDDFHLSGVEEDRELMGRCLAGEVSAWDELYCRCHAALSSSIKVLLLGGGDSDLNLVDEIAARVWYALIENDGRLLARFDPRRGARLITFLRAVAKTEVSRHFRRERRRQRRERIALRGRPSHQPADDAETAALLREFLPTLAVGEREFYEDHLAGPLAGGGEIDREPLSVNARELRHRIREKLLRFLGYES